MEESAYTDAELYTIDRYWDRISRERTIEVAAEEKGLAKGLAEGLEKGLAEGRAEVEVSKAISVAKEMKDDGMPVDLIVKYTGLSEDEINSL